MGGFIFSVIVTIIAVAIAYYYLHIHPDGAYSKKTKPKTPEVEKDDGKDFWD